VVLHEYSIQGLALDHNGGREVIRPPQDEGSTSESEVDSKVVDRSDARRQYICSWPSCVP